LGRGSSRGSRTHDQGIGTLVFALDRGPR
jgi:hypothetical protein